MRYDRRGVEQLIPGIFDEERVLEREADDAPAPDMPKAQSDPRKSTDKWAELADVQRAWRLSPLSDRQRQAVVLIHALDHTYREAGWAMGVNSSTAMRNAEDGIGTLVEFMNHGFYDKIDNLVLDPWEVEA